VVEWVKGSALTPFRAVLDASQYDQFVGRYRQLLLESLGRQEPYFYPFKRILVWGRRP
jgi:trans-aconitate 2-methyltransferase